MRKIGGKRKGGLQKGVSYVDKRKRRFLKGTDYNPRRRASEDILHVFVTLKKQETE